MWRSPMFWRLFGFYSVLLLTAIGLLGVVIVNRVEQHYLEQIEESLRAKAILVQEVVRDRIASQTLKLHERIRGLRHEIATRITLIAEDGKVLADSDEDPEHMENHANRAEVRAAREARFGLATRFSTTVNQVMMYVALKADTGSRPVAYVRVALPIDKVLEQSAWLRRVVGSAGAVTGVAAMLLAFWLARRVSLPIQELTTGVERIAIGNYGQPVYAGGRDEVGTLARSFNEMSRRLEGQFSQIEQDRQQLRMILSSMVEGVVALDAEQHVLFVNDRAAQLLGFGAKAVTGRKFCEIVRKRSLQDMVRQALSESEPCQGELTWEGPTLVSLTVRAARLPGPPPRGAVLVIHDSSELRRLERLRRDFVADVSHELKTPLSVIKACVETLLEGAVEDAKHRGPFLAKIAEQAERLHSLILDLLSLARIESGKETFVLQAVPIRPVVEDSLERYRARAEAKGQSLEAVPPSSETTRSPVAAWADEEAVYQILDNLVDNALKYTPPGGKIWVRWRPINDQIRLEVEDTGIGIPEQDLPRIFERFYRVDKARSRDLGGTGLGLSIVKHLVQAVHGTVQATSCLGQGTTLTIELPRAPAS